MALGLNREEFVLDMPRTVAVKYFITKKLSIEQCTQLSGLDDTTTFIKYLATQTTNLIDLDVELGNTKKEEGVLKNE